MGNPKEVVVEHMVANAAEEFTGRHIGPREKDVQEMVRSLGVSSLDELIAKTVPASIRLNRALKLPEARTEFAALQELRAIASKNKIFRSFIGQGYADCIVPGVIQRNILENPGWYTQYTPYQAEIAQGRLEALLNFQTMVTEFSGMEISNSSLLDEGTAAAEAMAMFYRVQGSETKNTFFIAADSHPQNIAIVAGRAEPLGIKVVIGDAASVQFDESYFGACIQYPTSDGKITTPQKFIERAHAVGALVVVASDLMALTMLQAPGEFGADCVVGSTQRFGVPLGFGGPHAAFFATKTAYQRQMPGRVVGVSKDANGKSALRLALQTREQHIKRDKATSNICTAQVLLAVMASMYAVYHGPQGIRTIAERIHDRTVRLATALKSAGLVLRHATFFDTLRIEVPHASVADILRRASEAQVNLRKYEDDSFGVTLDETVTDHDLGLIVDIFKPQASRTLQMESATLQTVAIDTACQRRSPILTAAIFNQYHSETEMLRYIRKLESRDLSLTTSMIPLGSCTMKLNASSEMFPVSWPEFSKLHPFAPLDQARGYQQVFNDLEQAIAEITGFSGVSLQPNAGSQGEYAGLLVIQAYHQARGDTHRTVCLIPESAHGTNPASAVMAGMQVCVVKCDSNGSIDVADLAKQAEAHAKNLSSLMVTYPSTHGVFEDTIRKICEIVHQHGGQVYMDGANLNAQVGLCRPGDIGADVCHLNLHKTFCIPHGGGGPGMGPIAVAKHLMEYLPGHMRKEVGGSKAIAPISAAPWGSASILLIPWMYIRMMGAAGLKRATEVAILNANYVAHQIRDSFDLLFKGDNGFVAHECILDFRGFKKTADIEVADVAKRLMDFGFHAPTVAWPVNGTLMIEPTESESKAELDRFCAALRQIRAEIRAIEEGKADRLNNVLKNSPHPAETVVSNNWDRPYSREEAAYPVASLREHKFWPAVARIDNAYGDRNLVCSCIGPDLSA
jgi:glycine dehydrogenase